MGLSDMMKILEDVNDTNASAVFLPKGCTDWSNGIKINSVAFITTSEDETLILFREDESLL